MENNSIDKSNTPADLNYETSGWSAAGTKELPEYGYGILSPTVGKGGLSDLYVERGENCEHTTELLVSLWSRGSAAGNWAVQSVVDGLQGARGLVAPDGGLCQSRRAVIDMAGQGGYLNIAGATCLNN